jgi:hypothetical protein
MRAIRSASFVLPLWLCVQAGDTGVTPRGAPANYPAHQETASASLAAARLKPDQVAKTFNAEIERNYIVVEVALYPKDGTSVDVTLFDFSLRFGGQQETRPDTPEQAAVWREKDPIKDKVQVTSETGVVIGSQTDPVTGRRTTGVGTYEATGVAIGTRPPGECGADPRCPDNRPDPRTPPGGYPDPRYPNPAPRGPDPRLVEDRLHALALPEVRTSKPVAGYLYFAKPQKKTKDNSLELLYSKSGSTVTLSLPAK